MLEVMFSLSEMQFLAFVWDFGLLTAIVELLGF